MNKKNQDPKSPVVLANIQRAQEAEYIASILRAEGVECYLQNLNSNQVLSGYVENIGVRIEVPAEQYEKATEVLCAYDIALPSDSDTEVAALTRWVERIPFMGGASLERKLWGLLIVTVCALLLLAVILFFSGSIHL